MSWRMAEQVLVLNQWLTLVEKKQSWLLKSNWFLPDCILWLMVSSRHTHSLLLGMGILGWLSHTALEPMGFASVEQGERHMFLSMQVLFLEIHWVQISAVLNLSLMIQTCCRLDVVAAAQPGWFYNLCQEGALLPQSTTKCRKTGIICRSLLGYY